MLKRRQAACFAVSILSFFLGLAILEASRRGLVRAPLGASKVGQYKEKSSINNHRAEPDSAEAAAKWRHLAWMDGNGWVEPGSLARAAEQRRDNLSYWRANSGYLAADLSRTSWTSRGPQNVGGRSRALVIHPTNPNIMWAASVSGGIWKTTDGGTTWTPLDDFMANLAANSLAIDPSNPNILYCGTGEGFFYSDGLQGDGIFKTTDGGASWTQLASTASWAGSGLAYVNRIAIAPGNSNLILAGTSNGGIQRSTDGGLTWTTTWAAQGCLDVAFDSTDGSKAIAEIFDSDTQIYHTALYSTDGGATWQKSSLQHVEAQFPGAMSGIFCRIELAYAPSSPNIVYASVWTDLGISCSSPPCTNIGSIWRSTDGGVTYSRTTSTIDTGAGDINNALWVSPVDPNFILVGGTFDFKSTDGGQTFTQISSGYILTDQPHPDQHFIVSDPGFNGSTNKRVYVCNDGGIFRTDDITAANTNSGWVSLNATYQTTQYYGAAGNASTGLLIGGTQDNGTLRSPLASQNATLMLGGDGGFCAVDPTDDSYCYGENPELEIFRSQDHGQTGNYIISGLTDAGGAASFVAPFILDPNNSNIMLAGGVRLWRCTNVRAAVMPTWTEILGLNPIGDSVSAIAVAPGNSNIIWVGYQNGTVFKTTNGLSATPTWTAVDDNMSHDPLPNRFITRILVDPRNSNIVCVTLGGFTDGNLQRTTDGGLTWSDISGSGATGLPFAPIRGIARDPSNSKSLYVGTEVGVFSTLDGGSTWSAASVGPANVSVDELVFLPNSTTLLAATHGRGLWTADIGSTPPNYVGFIDVSSCNSIGGWAADMNQLNDSINVELYDGANLVAVVPAFRLRTDVGAFLGDNGLHGFTLPIPSALKDGTMHTIHIKFQNSSAELSGSPLTINCSSVAPSYIGFIDVSNCTSIGGWVADLNHLNQPISVSIYDGTTLLVTLKAGQLRTDVGAFLGDNGLHGFSTSTPSALTTGTAHSVHLKFETGSTEMSGSPVALTCP